MCDLYDNTITDLTNSLNAFDIEVSATNKHAAADSMRGVVINKMITHGYQENSERDISQTLTVSLEALPDFIDSLNEAYKALLEDNEAHRISEVKKAGAVRAVFLASTTPIPPATEATTL